MEVTNDNNMNKFNNSHKRGVWLVWYFADWCGHCHSMVPEWKSLMDNNVHNVNLAKVRDDYQSKVALDAPVQGYPTIVLVKNGNVSKVFSGERTADSLNSFVGENSTAKELNANNSGLGSNQSDSGEQKKSKKAKKATKATKAINPKKRVTRRRKPTKKSKKQTQNTNANNMPTKPKKSRKRSRSKKVKTNTQNNANNANNENNN